jgi:hypothetical protein
LDSSVDYEAIWTVQLTTRLVVQFSLLRGDLDSSDEHKASCTVQLTTRRFGQFTTRLVGQFSYYEAIWTVKIICTSGIYLKNVRR